MLYETKTEIGTIRIDKAVIGAIIKDAAATFENKVFISNAKGNLLKFWNKISGIDEVNYMQISSGEEGLDIKFYVILRFGTSISKVTKQMIADIRKNIMESTGLPVHEITIIITGLIASKLTKRNIEIRG